MPWLSVPGLIVLLSAGAVAVDERRLIPPCAPERTAPPAPGAVVRLFELHKSHNPQNVLVIHTYADERCRLIGRTAGKHALVDMYWRMNVHSPGECYKPTHPRIKSETWKTLEVTSLSGDRKRLRIEITPLDQLDHDLPTREAEVALEPTRSGCSAEVRLPLASGAVMRLRQIDAEASARIPGRSIEALDLVGLDERNRTIRRRYRAKQRGREPRAGSRAVRRQRLVRFLLTPWREWTQNRGGIEMKRTSWLAPMVAAVGLCLACEGRRSDESISEDFARLAQAEPALAGADLMAVTDDGEITLRGTVPSERARESAEDLASEIRGVKGVRNEVLVHAPALPAPPALREDSREPTLPEDERILPPSIEPEPGDLAPSPPLDPTTER